MPQPRKSLPRYLKHPSGKGRIVWTDATGTRRYKLLPGLYNSPESLEAFHRLQLELAVSPAPKLAVTDTGPTVAEVLLPYRPLRRNVLRGQPGTALREVTNGFAVGRSRSRIVGGKPSARFHRNPLAGRIMACRPFTPTNSRNSATSLPGGANGLETKG